MSNKDEGENDIFPKTMRFLTGTNYCISETKYQIYIYKFFDL